MFFVVGVVFVMGQCLIEGLEALNLSLMWFG